MSPISQFAAVATLTFAVLGFQTVALALLGATLVLMLIGFVTPLLATQPPPAPQDEAPVREPTPNDVAAEG